MIRIILKKVTTLILLALLIACGNNSAVKLRPLAPNAVILALGDSLTSGRGARLKNSYPSQLSLLLDRKVINEGVPGHTSAQGLARLPKLLKKYQPQLVIVSLGGNDLLRRKPLHQIKENLSEIIQLIQKNNIKLILIAPPKPSINLKAPALYNELANEYKIIVEDKLLSKLLSDENQKSDKIHLNAKGYRNLAEGIYQLLKKHHAIK